MRLHRPDAGTQRDAGIKQSLDMSVADMTNAGTEILGGLDRVTQRFSTQTDGALAQISQTSQQFTGRLEETTGRVYMRLEETAQAVYGAFDKGTGDLVAKIGDSASGAVAGMHRSNRRPITRSMSATRPSRTAMTTTCGALAARSTSLRLQMHGYARPVVRRCSTADSYAVVRVD